MVLEYFKYSTKKNHDANVKCVQVYVMRVARILSKKAEDQICIYKLTCICINPYGIIIISRCTGLLIWMFKINVLKYYLKYCVSTFEQQLYNCFFACKLNFSIAVFHVFNYAAHKTPSTIILSRKLHKKLTKMRHPTMKKTPFLQLLTLKFQKVRGQYRH